MNDAYAYLAYAEGLYLNGVTSDMTYNPPGPPQTIQNGIIVIHSILRIFIEDMVVRIHILNLMLTFNLCVIFYILYKLAILLKIDRVGIFYLLFSFSFSYYFYGYFVVPTNDGFFASLTLLAIYYIIKLFEEDRKNYYFILILIAVLAPNFRIQSIIVFIAALLSSLLLLKKYKISFFMFLLILLGYGSLSTSSYFFIDDFNQVKDQSNSIISNLYNFDFPKIRQLLFDVVNVAIPSAILNFSATRLTGDIFTTGKVTISLTVLGFILFNFFNAFKNKNFNHFFINLFIIGNLLVLLLFEVVVDRYIYITVPLIILLATSYFNNKHHYKIFLVLLIFNISIFGYRVYVKNYDSISVVENINFLNNKLDDYSLISQIPRKTYFYLKKPSVNDYRILNENSTLLIIGDDFFVQEKLKKIEKIFEIKDSKTLPINWTHRNNLTQRNFELDTIIIYLGSSYDR